MAKVTKGLTQPKEVSGKMRDNELINLIQDLRVYEDNPLHHTGEYVEPEKPRVFDVDAFSSTGFLDDAHLVDPYYDKGGEHRYYNRDLQPDKLPPFAMADFRQMAQVMWNSNFAYSYNRTPDWEWFEAAHDAANDLHGHNYSILFAVRPMLVHTHRYAEPTMPHLRCEVSVEVHDEDGRVVRLSSGAKKVKYIRCLVDISMADYEKLCVESIKIWDRGNPARKRLMYEGYGEDVHYPELWKHKEAA